MMRSALPIIAAALLAGCASVNPQPAFVDVQRKVVDLEVPESVLAERRKSARVFGAQDQRGWLGVYQRTVAPVHEGAVLAPKA